MTSCPKCGAQVASEAALCADCGTKLGPPNVAALRASALSYIQGVSGKTQPQQKIVIAGSVLTLVGAFLPFYVINLPEGMGGSFSFLHTGLPGALTVLVAIALGLIGVMPAPSRLLNVLGFGGATLVLGMVLASITASAMGPASIAAAGAEAAGIMGRGIGAYILGAGAIVLEYAYVQRVMAGM